MKRDITCNKCNNRFQSKALNLARIRCPECGSDESLSVREDYCLDTNSLRRAAESTDDLREMSKNYQHEDGAYWPAFYLNWAADEIDRLNAGLTS